MSGISQVQIKTSLPYCLYRIDTRFFKLGDEFNSKIRFVKVETTPNRRTQSSQNVEVIRDRWGIDAHSDVEIYTDKTFANVVEAEISTLKIINDFIKRYRFYDRDAVHLVPLTREDLFGLNFLSDGRGIMSASFAGGITVVNPLRNHEISNKIEQSVTNKEDIPLWEELLLNAEQYLYQTEFRHSVLESIIALELVVSEFVRKRCQQKGISNKVANNYLKNVGLTGNIEVTLRLLLDNRQLPDQIILQKCKASINIRNAIVHKGRKNILSIDAQDSLKYSKMLINFLIQYL